MAHPLQDNSEYQIIIDTTTLRYKKFLSLASVQVYFYKEINKMEHFKFTASHEQLWIFQKYRWRDGDAITNACLAVLLHHPILFFFFFLRVPMPTSPRSIFTAIATQKCFIRQFAATYANRGMDENTKIIPSTRQIIGLATASFRELWLHVNRYHVSAVSGIESDWRPAQKFARDSFTMNKKGRSLSLLSANLQNYDTHNVKIRARILRSERHAIASE